MKFFLKLKHWQLFFITWGIPILIDVVTFSNPLLMIRLFPVMMIAFSFGVFGWVWAIGTELSKGLPENVHLNVLQFKFMFAIPILYIVAILALLTYQQFQGPNGQGLSIGVVAVPLLIIVHLASMVCIFLSLRFAAKAMKSVELGRMAKFADYSGEFFLIWFSVIGIWILQPRLNRLVQ